MRGDRVGAGRRAGATVAVVLVGAALTACGGGSNSTATTTTATTITAATTTAGTPPAPHPPIATTAADWKPVTDILGRTGKLSDSNTTYRIALPRNDLAVVTQDVPIKPGLSLGGYAVFGKYDDGVMLMGDLSSPRPS